MSRSRPNATPTTRSRCAAEFKRIRLIPDILECLGTLAGDADSHREAARLFGAAQAIRQRMGAVRFKIYDAGYEASVAALRDALGEHDFDSAWAEGAALSTEEAIAYAQRGRGERKRPASGWASLTPTELDVVRLVSEGLGNNDIADKAFRLTAHRANPPHPRLHQTRPHFAAYSSPKKQPATPNPWGAKAFDGVGLSGHYNYRCCIDFAYTASQPTVLPDRKVRHCSHCFGGYRWVQLAA